MEVTKDNNILHIKGGEDLEQENKDGEVKIVVKTKQLDKAIKKSKELKSILKSIKI